MYEEGELNVLSFNLDNSDYLYADATFFRGTNGPQGMHVHPGDSIYFNSDSYFQASGFEFCFVAEGSCFSGDSTVLARHPETRTTVSKQISELKAGDEVVSVNHFREKQFSKVVQLPHSKSSGDFIDIKVVSSAEVPALMQLRATEHHTFPKCSASSAGTLEQQARHLRASSPQANEDRSTWKAGELKPGDCLLTLEGEGTVASAERAAASPTDATYTVQLEGSENLLIVGGVVTHARPSHTMTAFE